MSAPGPTPAEREEKGIARLSMGAALGIAGAAVALVAPIVFVLIVAFAPGGFFTFQTTFVEVTGALVIAGAVLLLVSLFVYRRAFAQLRKVDRRFVAASVLCLVGSLGFLLLIVAATLVIGNSGSLLSCVKGQPSHALTCLRSGNALGAYTGLAGFWLGWLGGVGIVLGVSFAGSRFGRGAFYGGAVTYAILLLLLIGPFLNLLTPVPGIRYLLWGVPVFSLVAPGLVLAGSRTAAAGGSPR